MSVEGQRIGAFHSERSGLAKLLGPLEAELMEFVWSEGRPVTARDVETGSGTSAKYVTVLTVLNNLEKKGILRRERHGKQFLFEPVKSREEFLASVSEHVVRGLFDLSPRIAVNSFVETLDALSPEELAELQEELAAYVRRRDHGDRHDSE
ncbi:MAG: BlaI/MecI/CopY family transcriptional regulator [Gemmatimonadota bacterium]